MCVACTLLLVCFWLMHLSTTLFCVISELSCPLPNLPHDIFKLAGMGSDRALNRESYHGLRSWSADG